MTAPNIPDLQRLAQMQEMKQAMSQQFVAETAQLIYSQLVAFLLIEMYKDMETEDMHIDASSLRGIARSAKDTAPFLAKALGIIGTVRPPNERDNGEHG